LDSVYEEYMEWEEYQREEIISCFKEILNDCQLIFGADELEALSATRFRQKADFYSLFGAIYNLRRRGGNLLVRDLNPLRADLYCLNYNIEPSSNISLFQEYAIRCVSDANSASSRRWRINFLECILQGTYLREISGDSARFISTILYEMNIDGSEFCGPMIASCLLSDEEFEPTEKNSFVAWSRENLVFQMENAGFIKREILESVDYSDWLIIDPLSDWRVINPLSQQSNIGRDQMEINLRLAFRLTDRPISCLMKL